MLDNIEEIPASQVGWTTEVGGNASHNELRRSGTETGKSGGKIQLEALVATGRTSENLNRVPKKGSKEKEKKTRD